MSSPAAPEPRPRRGEQRAAAFLKQASEPLFLLDSRRRLVYANPAWEACTGFPLDEVRGRSCRRTPAAAADRLANMLRALAPPPEVLQGRHHRCRRPLSTAGGIPLWTEILFLPWNGPAGLEGILGRLRPLPRAAVPPGPLPDKILALRDRRSHDLDSLPGAGPAMRLLRERLRLAAAAGRPVLLRGEPGSGKRWCARALFALSPRRDRFLACLDARRLPPAALDAWLFPPEHGTGVRLGGIYLAAVDHLPLDLQDRLARSLADADEDDARPWVFLGTAGDPEELLRSGRLSEELFCTAAALVLHVPPLRDRLLDLPEIVAHLLPRAARAVQSAAVRLDPAALDVLRLHAWPGNLTELHRVLVEACRRTPGDTIAAAALPHYLRAAPAPTDPRLPLDDLLQEAEKRLLTLALRLAAGNKARACDILGIWRPRLLRRLEALGITE